METKTLPLADAAVASEGNGTFSGLASGFDGVDSYGDQIQRGAYLETIPKFLVDGFIGWSHAWDNPIATPKSAVENDRGLFITAEFHSDPEAQRARTITTERLERGKSMGLSIGYEAVEWTMRKVDTPIRGAWGQLTDEVRVLTKIKLFEVSLVTVGADSMAHVTDAKGRGVLPFDDHTEAVRVALAEWVKRVKSGSDIREKVGRPISEARRTRMASVSTQVRSAADEIDAMLEETAPAPKSDLARLRFDTDRILARVRREGMTA